MLFRWSAVDALPTQLFVSLSVSRISKFKAPEDLNSGRSCDEAQY